jgi:predicted RND superfamily exporter protein
VGADPGAPLGERAGAWLVAHTGPVLAVGVLLTAALIAPMVWLAPTEAASTEPAGEEFTLRDAVDQRLASATFATAYIAESPTGDVLTPAALAELAANQQALRDADAAGLLAPEGAEPGRLLLERFDADTGLTYTGLTGLPDAVAATLALTAGVTLAEASEAQVKAAVAALLASERTAGLAEQLSVQATRQTRMVDGEEVDWWVSPALLVVVLADNEALGGLSRFAGLATSEAGLARERFARTVQTTLRGEQAHYRLWGLAIDQTLAAEEQGRTAGMFITFTVIAALAVVGLSLRSYWATALTAAGIGALMIWLKGLSALVGIKGGIIVDLMVPIAMVSLGVDFAVHAVRRYREERGPGIPPPQALRAGFAGVLGALVLAMASDGIAFLSNVPSGIEAVVHFGIAAGISVVSALVVLGVAVPLALARVDTLLARAPGPGGRTGLSAALAGGLAATGLAGAGVIVLVALSPAGGAGILAASALLTVGLPLAVLARRGRRASTPAAGTPAHTGPARAGGGRGEALIATLVTGPARRPWVTLAIATVLTGAALVFALRLEASFDVKDFFSPGSDLVVGLDKLDAHVGSRSGEAGIIYLQGALADPAFLRAAEAFIEDLRENPFVGREADGAASVFEQHAAAFVRHVAASPYARGQVARETGVVLTDEDADGLPDTPAQVGAVFAYITAHGVPASPAATLYTPDQVGTALSYDASDPSDVVTIITVGIPGTREQRVIAGAREALRADLAPLAAHPAITRAGLTGSPFVRDASLTATVRSLRTSIPLAAAGALVLLVLALRSVRLAAVTVVPIGLVVVWLYALMELTGLALNFVTATIGAVSIGVGIDYSIHMTERYREELKRTGGAVPALERAARGTGISLLASAGSSVLGFTIMGFAPMPLFATYGALTALMIFLALAASLAVLPSLLRVATTPPGADA